MQGLKICHQWLKLCYKRAVQFHCEECNEVFEEKQLEIHRIIQGWKGGKYRPGNIKVVCKPCHDLYGEAW